MQKENLKTSLCSVPVEGTGFKIRKDRSQGQVPVLPKTAILSLIEAMKKAGFPKTSYDFFDIIKFSFTLIYARDIAALLLITEKKRYNEFKTNINC